MIASRYITYFLILMFLLSAVSSSFAKDITAPGFRDAADAFEVGNYVVAADQFRVLAERGNATAQFNYAQLLYKGVGTTVNFEEAWYWSWMARLEGINEAIKLSNSIARDLTIEHEVNLIGRLRNTFEQEARIGDADALSKMAIFLTEAQTEPNLAEGYVWALVAQAVGQTDVKDIIQDANENLDLAARLESQKKARLIFEKFKND